MKKSFIAISVLSGIIPLWATPPASVSAHSIRMEMEDSQVARTELHGAPQGPWYSLENLSDFVLDFPITDKNAFTTDYPRPGGGTSEIRVSYTPQAADNSALVSLENEDFCVLVTLNFSTDTSGTASIRWDEAGNTRHFRRVRFSISQEDPGPGIVLPEEQIAHDPELWDDGLQDILRELSEHSYRSATDKLYQKRLTALLPLVGVFHDASYTSPDFKGNTALHYACGLSHTELVRWLVNHGADLEARTEKGASVDACIGGSNAAAIKNILKQARRERDYPIRGPQVSEEEAAVAVKWLERAFTCDEVDSAHYELCRIDSQAQEHGEALYLYVRQCQDIPRQVNKTEPLGCLLIWLKNANVDRAMFTEALQKQLYRLRAQALHERQINGKALAMLPHMMLMREEEGMNYNGANALYRACAEGNVPLVKWLLEHGAERKLRDASGQVTKLPPNTPNAAIIQQLLNN